MLSIPQPPLAPKHAVNFAVFEFFATRHLDRLIKSKAGAAMYSHLKDTKSTYTMITSDQKAKLPVKRVMNVLPQPPDASSSSTAEGSSHFEPAAMTLEQMIDHHTRSLIGHESTLSGPLLPSSSSWLARYHQQPDRHGAIGALRAADGKTECGLRVVIFAQPGEAVYESALTRRPGDAPMNASSAAEAAFTMDPVR